MDELREPQNGCECFCLRQNATLSCDVQRRSCPCMVTLGRGASYIPEPPCVKSLHHKTSWRGMGLHPPAGTLVLRGLGLDLGPHPIRW